MAGCKDLQGSACPEMSEKWPYGKELLPLFAREE
jgi:hypothetical protein